MSAPITVAIAGLGRAGWAIHAEQLRQREDFQVIDITDPDRKRCREAEEQLRCRSHPDLAALLRHSPAELVVIATPSILHESDARQVFRSRRHCVMEKPMAMSYAGARRMIAAARRARRKLFVHQNLRFTKEFRHLRDLVASGTLGRICAVRVTMSYYARRNDWQTLRRNGGGLLNNAGPHLLDQTLQLLDGPIVSVASDLQHVKDAGDSEDHVQLFMKTRRGQVVDMLLSTSSALSAGPKWVFLGTHGALSSDGATTTLRYYDPQQAPELKLLDGPALNRRYGNGEVLPWKEETRLVEATTAPDGFYDNVAAVLRRGAKMTVTPASVAEHIRIIDWARRGTKFTVGKRHQS